ncbi:lysozyme inhibitor [Tamlana haliotis]|uniref:Lysozyme inhibitor n=1 Tax=Pseudotamlana haliotis TaxID=2614804 RepID=A0A6N6MBQ2_9FLAO|nr:MliC family protein [Tamlana haliotis]KAB1068027.1 lysozyme inhibitor [Tamlana haliotis]
MEIRTDDIIETEATDANGKILYLIFNNTKGNVTIDFEGDIAVLKSERTGSGFWYKNKTYNLRGKGNHMTMKKDGVVVFEN